MYSKRKYIPDTSGKDVMISAKEYKEILTDFELMAEICHKGVDAFGDKWYPFIREVTLSDHIQNRIQNRIEAAKIN